MRIPLLLVVCALACVFAGCEGSVIEAAPYEAAPTGAAPPVRVPMGPMPGPGEIPETVRSPYARDDVALQEGRTLFVWYNCAGCHGGRGGGGSGPSLRDKTWLYGESDAHIYASIADGRRFGMPAWGYKLPDEQIWKIVSYIDSMGTPREPSPPDTTQPQVSVAPEGVNTRLRN